MSVFLTSFLFLSLYSPNDSKKYTEAFASGPTAAPAPEDRFDTHEGAHFLVRFEGGENAVAGHLIGLLLEEAYLKVGSDLDYYPTDTIEAVLYSREEFRDITKSPSWAGALYDGRIKIPAGGVREETDALEKVIFHEYTHALVHRLSHGRAPMWLNEGIAQYEEGLAPDREFLKELLAADRISLRDLEGSFVRLDRKRAQAAYQASLSATQYIVREFGASAVKRIFLGLSGGLSLDNAIRSAVYLSYEDLERSWRTSLLR